MPYFSFSRNISINQIAALLKLRKHQFNDELLRDDEFVTWPVKGPDGLLYLLIPEKFSDVIDLARKSEIFQEWNAK